MNPPTEQLIRDYLNRLSVAARGQLGFSERQSLLDRTRARIEAECGSLNGASAATVRKALAALGDPIALVELEVGGTGGSVGQVEVVGKASAPENRHDPAPMGNGYEIAVSGPPASEIVKGSEIGEDPPVTDGSLPNGSESGGVVSSARSARPGFTAAQRRLRKSDSSDKSSGASAVASGSSGASAGAGGSGASAGAGGSGASAGGGGSGTSAASAGGSSRVPAQRRPLDLSRPGAPRLAASRRDAPRPDRPGHRSPELMAAPGPVGGTGSGGGTGGGGSGQPDRVSGSTAAQVGVLSALLRAAWDIAINNKLEIVALVLMGIGGAAYPPIWLLGVALALPSRKWDMNDKFAAITLPVLAVIVGTVLVIVFRGQQGSIGSYPYEAWLAAGRLSRAFALAGAIYLAWGLHRGRRKPKQPPWNRQHRVG